MTTTMMTTTERYLDMRCKAFSGEGVRLNRLRVVGRDVTVLDSTAGHYTHCHVLSRKAADKARKMAR